MGMNPIKTTRQLVANLAATNDDDEPNEWDSPGRTSRLREYLRLYKYLIFAGVFFAMAMAMFIFPVLPSAHRNYWTPAIGIWALSLAYVHVKSRGSGLRELSNYHLNILFLGNTIVPRLGKRTGNIDDKTWGLKVLKKFDYGGLSTAFEQFHDRYSRSEIGDHKEKYHRIEGDGSGDVVRGVLEPTSAEAEGMEYDIDLFEGISVTHAGQEDDSLSSKDRDTETTLPPTIDERITSEVRGAFMSEKHGREMESRKVKEIENYVDDLEEYVDPAGQPIFDSIMTGIQEMNTQRQRTENSTEENDGVDLPERPPSDDEGRY